MMRNYFEVNGEKYYTGTVFIVKNMGKQVEATFICYNTERSLYVYKIDRCRYYMHNDMFVHNFVCVTDKRNMDARMPVTKTRKDMDIDGLFIGWVWYIFLMALATIFKENIGLWILISVIFFSWRSEKIKKEGTYIEW